MCQQCQYALCRVSWAHLWSLVFYCDLVVSVRVFPREERLQSLIDLNKEAARLEGLLVCCCQRGPTHWGQWRLTMTDTASLGHTLRQRGIAGRAVYVLQPVSDGCRQCSHMPLTAE